MEEIPSKKSLKLFLRFPRRLFNEAMMQDILIANNYIDVFHHAVNDAPVMTVEFSTVLSNLAHYGFTLDREAVLSVSSLSGDQLVAWWKEVQPVLAELSKENRNISEHMVYRNFPREVLDMELAEYVFLQSMIYMGIPYDAAVEKAEPRHPLGDMSRLRVLALADENTTEKLYLDLVKTTNRWSDNQQEWASRLVGLRNIIHLGDFAFKENGIALIAKHFHDREINIQTGTDVLRLCAALSDGDVSLRQKVKLRSFKRPERRKLLAILDETSNLSEDMATRPEMWKRLLERLRPGDYGFENVKAAQDSLYNKAVKSFNAMIDPQIMIPEVLDVAAQRPGEFLRRFHHFYDLFGDLTVDKFIPIMDKLTTRQLVNFRSYLGSINDRMFMIYPPKANWARAQVSPNTKGKITVEHWISLDGRIGEILRDRLAVSFPEGVSVDPAVNQIKLQTNDQKLTEYGRGTVFDIPEGMTFVRSASYWQNENHCWFDNGWNFFDADWQAAGVLSWSQPKFHDAAAFSGDPMNSGNELGKATQVIDLYLDKLAKKGVRFAVWNILCYSNIKFSDASGEVLALLQWGTDAQKGEVFEPARAQMTFPLKQESLTSYVAYIDIEKRKLVFMDAPLRGQVDDAESNSETLSGVMPAYVEYLNSLPSVLDLIKDARAGTMPIRYSDQDVDIETSRAFVFRPENAENTYDKVSIADLLAV